jgi:hypothetical protein
LTGSKGSVKAQEAVMCPFSWASGEEIRQGKVDIKEHIRISEALKEELAVSAPTLETCDHSSLSNLSHPCLKHF